MNSLAEVILDRTDGAAILDLREEVGRFPELIEPFVPPQFNYRLRHGSRLITTDRGDIDVELSLTFWPRGMPESNVNLSTAARAFSTEGLFATHRYLTIASGLQGRGIGRRLVRSAAALYRDLDIPEVDLLAVDIGRYAWAMCGFEPDPDVRADVLEGVLEAARSLGFELEEVDETTPLWDLDLIDEHVTGRELVAALGDLEMPAAIADDLEKPIRLGKALLLCSRIEQWLGKLDLGDTPGYDQLIDYSAT